MALRRKLVRTDKCVAKSLGPPNTNLQVWWAQLKGLARRISGQNLSNFGGRHALPKRAWFSRKPVASCGFWGQPVTLAACIAFIAFWLVTPSCTNTTEETVMIWIRSTDTDARRTLALGSARNLRAPLQHVLLCYALKLLCLRPKPPPLDSVSLSCPCRLVARVPPLKQ